MRNKNYKYSINKGFTLLEMIFALGLFSLVITMVMGVFVKSSQIQRKVIELHTVQREGSYMIEMMSREMRTATAIDETQACNNDYNIKFTNYEGNPTEYCRSNSNGVCLASGEYLSRNNKVINSSNVRIADLKFYSSDFRAAWNNEQPMVTISMKMKPTTSQFDTEISLQNSVVLRVY